MNGKSVVLRNALLVGGTVIASAVFIIAAFPTPAVLIAVSDGFPLALSVVGAVLAYAIFRGQRSDPLGARVWGSMTVGLVCWAGGELIWLLYDLVGWEGVPTPSPADILWLVGYVPIGLSIGSQYISLRVSIPRRRRWVMGAIIALAAVLILWFIVIPVLTDPQAGPPREIFIDLVYPFADFVLLGLAFGLVMVFVGGQLALFWGVIAAGIFLDSISDLLFGYATWNGLYYPEGRLTPLSGTFDILYISAYVVWMIGLYLRRSLPEPGKDVDLRPFVPESGKDFLLMTDPQGRLVFIDPPLLPMIGLAHPSEGIGKPFGSVVGLARLYEQGAIRKADKTGLSDDYRISLGLSKAKYLLRVIPSSDPEQFPGFEIVIHPVGGPSAQDRSPNGILGQVADRVRERERRRLSGEEDPLAVYVGTVIDWLFVLISRVGGAEVGAAFEGILNECARREGCGFRVADGRSSWTAAEADPDTCRRLMAEAVRYGRLVLSPSTIRRKIEEMEKYMDPGVVREAEEHRLRGVRRLEETSG